MLPPGDRRRGSERLRAGLGGPGGAVGAAPVAGTRASMAAEPLWECPGKGRASPVPPQPLRDSPAPAPLPHGAAFTLLTLCILVMKSMDVISIKDNYIFKLNIKFCTKTKLHEISVCSRAARQRARERRKEMLLHRVSRSFPLDLLLARCSPVLQVTSRLFPHLASGGSCSLLPVPGRPLSHGRFSCAIPKGIAQPAVSPSLGRAGTGQDGPAVPAGSDTCWEMLQLEKLSC